MKLQVNNRPNQASSAAAHKNTSLPESETAPLQLIADGTGLPSGLKAGIENLSGYSMNDVSVHYNSKRPAQLQAYAFAQGNHIHVAPGQERHLPHEAWHVVQQKQGRVQPTVQMKTGTGINDDTGLENEADRMGAKAMQMKFMPQAIPRNSGVWCSTGVVQRAGVGGAKIGFEKTASEAATREEADKGIKLLMEAWTEATGTRKAKKATTGTNMAQYDTAVTTDRTRLKELETAKATHTVGGNLNKANYNVAKDAINAKPAFTAAKATITHLDPTNKNLTKLYYDKLVEEIEDEEVLLKKASQFVDGRLKLEGDTISYRMGNGTYLAIATVKRGNDAYQNSNNQEGRPRTVFTKKGFEKAKTQTGGDKEYIKDSRGAITRRYAYVEKNYYQMMEFFMTEHLTGRFQQYMLAGGDRKPGIRKFTTQMVKNVPQPAHKGAEMTDTQVAVTHQMYGSLPEQRGVSLTSTPKEGVTYANTGGNFRTDEGFKLKIDLARVPDDVLMLNHYGAGGVSGIPGPRQDYSVQQTHKGPGKSYAYKYKESALHARELYLEHIKPEWVVEIEHHTKGGFNNPANVSTTLSEAQGGGLLARAKEQFGGNVYEKGFAVGVTAAADIPVELAVKPHYDKGKGTGGMVREGYTEGQKRVGVKGKATADNTFTEVMEDATLVDKMSPYHVGYTLARTGQPLIKSPGELKLLLNEDANQKNIRAEQLRIRQRNLAVGTGVVIALGILGKIAFSWFRKGK